MNPDLEAMAAASPYNEYLAQLPENPKRGDVVAIKHTKRPQSHWPVVAYDGEVWVCIGHGQETELKAASASWVFTQLDKLSVGNCKEGTLST